VLLSDESRHALDDGDEVEFLSLDGMDELAAGGPRAVSVTGANTFIIPDDARTYGSFGSGYCRELPRRRTVSFRSLAEELQQPTLSSVDGNADAALHAAFCALDAHEVRPARGFRPEAALHVLTQEPLSQCSEHASPHCQGAPELLQTLLRAPRFDVCPVAAVVGAFAAAEALKAGSGIYLPLRQWLYIDLSEAAAPETVAAHGGEAADPHAAVYGAETLAALAALRVLVAGAGGVAGEALKNMALLGVGCAASGGSITVADDQSVTVSNLARGVLLRATDLGRSKAEAVSERGAALGLRPSVHHLCARVGGDGACAQLTDDALAQFGVLAAAVNSFSGRLLLDERCVRARLPWVDAGVDGPLAYVQPVVPYASVPWSAGARDRPAREAPSCVLRNFPYMPWHTVDWARGQFDALFSAMPSEVNAYLGKRDYLDSLSKKPAATRLHALRALGESLVHHRPLSLQACITWARAAFDDLFFNAPHALLAAFPPGATAPDGSAFWCVASWSACLALLTPRSVAGTGANARPRRSPFLRTTSCTSPSWSWLQTCTPRCTA
jgi:ubiquitin-activating enzyme E1